jgi:hypothetical protein
MHAIMLKTAVQASLEFWEASQINMRQDTDLPVSCCRLPQDAVLQAAASLSPSVSTMAAAVSPPEAAGCTGLMALHEALRGTLLVQRMKDIPNDAPDRGAMVAMQVVLQLEVGTIGVAGGFDLCVHPTLLKKTRTFSQLPRSAGKSHDNVVPRLPVCCTMSAFTAVNVDCISSPF